MKLANGLTNNLYLEHLNLQGNHLRTNSGEAFSKVTLENRVLKTLKLKFNMIKYHFIVKIGLNLERNKRNLDD